MHRIFPRLLSIAAPGCTLLCLLAAAQQTGTPPKPAEPPAEAAKQVTPQTAEPAKNADDIQTFTSQVQQVILPVTVKDEKGRFISNLKASDFRVMDEGRPQRIAFFSHAEKQPIVVGFLIDQSSNMRIQWDKYREAIRELVWNLLPGDPKYTGYLIQYGSKAELVVNTTQDSDKIASEVAKMKPGGGSALYDAIYRACSDRTLIKGEPYEPRRVIIIVGDGHDNASSRTLLEVLELAKRNMVTIYGMSTMSFGFSNPDQDVLERLTTETGGHVEYPLSKNLYKDVSGYLSHPTDDGNYALDVGTGGYASEIKSRIVQAISGISAEITSQYVLLYTPDIDPEGKPKDFRRIKVDIPSLPGITPLTRDGYYPNPVRAATKTGGQ
jgi:VWFA-related protein